MVFLAAWLASLSVLVGVASVQLMRRPLVAQGEVDWRRSTMGWLERAGEAVYPFLSDDMRYMSEQRILWAGRPLGFTAVELYGLKVTLAGLGFLAGGFLIPAGLPPVLVLVFGAVAFFAPDFWISLRVRRRQRQIIRALPDFADYLAMAVQAGLDLTPALGRVISYQTGALRELLEAAWDRIRAGANRVEALKAAADASGVREFADVVNVLNVALRTGTPVVDVLMEQSELMRSRLESEAEKRAQTANSMLLLPMMLFMFVPLVALMLYPMVTQIGNIFNL